jgi:hypothetical protein
MSEINQGLRSFGMMCCVSCQLFSDVSVNPTGPILTHEDETDRVSRNVGKQLLT